MTTDFITQVEGAEMQAVTVLEAAKQKAQEYLVQARASANVAAEELVVSARNKLQEEVKAAQEIAKAEYMKLAEKGGADQRSLEASCAEQQSQVVKRVASLFLDLTA